MTAAMPYTREDQKSAAWRVILLDRARVDATVEALDAHRAALRDLVRVVSMQLARGEETTPGEFEAAWKRAVLLTKENP